VLDYGERHYEPLPPDPELAPTAQHRRVRVAAATPPGTWARRPDSFSTHRAGFEIRTHRRCHRILQFHRFDELGPEPYLVRATSFDYADLPDARHAVDAVLAHQGSTRLASFLRSITRCGYVRDDREALQRRDGVAYQTYVERDVPALVLTYSRPRVADRVETLDATSGENLPVGLDAAAYRLADLDGEGLASVLVEHEGGWSVKRNLGGGRFGPLQPLAVQPAGARLAAGARLLDLAGDGDVDVVSFVGPNPGLYERADGTGWTLFRAFRALPQVDWDDPNLQLVDLNGDGRPDVLVTGEDGLTWYPSLGEDGFGPGLHVPWPDGDDEPRPLLADADRSVHLADMAGDGLPDLVRVRNGEVRYWPNQGHGRFGTSVTMDRAPLLDAPDGFDGRRVRLADVDGSGAADLLYLGRDGVSVHFNEAGDGWTPARTLRAFPRVDDLATVTTADLLGTGTACLIWSTPLAAEEPRTLRYVDLVGGAKPHLLVGMENGLGAETTVAYAPSTRFALADRLEGTPWVTRLPFPVHVVERVEVHDRVSGTRAVTRYAYHHGCYDGAEREFRGFALVEQWDSEGRGGDVDAVPPALTRTWFHTGVDSFALVGTPYTEPAIDPAASRGRLPPESVPRGAGPEEEREAWRALKGALVRQEVYGLDATEDPAGRERERHPYVVREQSFAVRTLQPRAGNRHAVFLRHPAATLTARYERDPSDPRVEHALTLEVDDFGNVLQEVSVAYGRALAQREPGDDLPPLPADRERQAQPIVSYAHSVVTEALADPARFPHVHRTPLPCETRTYELTGYTPAGDGGRFTREDFLAPGDGPPRLAADGEIGYEEAPTGGRQRRLVDHLRILYRADDLASILPLGRLDPRALPGERYRLAYTAGLLAEVFRRDGEPLLADPAAVLGAKGGEGGGYVAGDELVAAGRFPADDRRGQWWIPSGRVFLSPGSSDAPAEELAFARRHFFLPLRSRDAFHTDAASTESRRTYDAYDLLLVESRDAVGNRITAGERRADGAIAPGVAGLDYRVLQPAVVSDANRNRTYAAYDALGMVAGTAVAGKPEEGLGDTLEGFVADLTDVEVAAYLARPLDAPASLLGRATTRRLHDLHAFARTRGDAAPRAVVLASLGRGTHDADLRPGERPALRHAFFYADGLGRVIGRKVRAEPGPLVPGGPAVAERWVGSGWVVFDGKGRPVRQFEPFFTATHAFEPAVESGVASVRFHDPVGRVVAVLHPDHTYEKWVRGAWHEATWDANDTVTGDPRTDPDVAGLVAAYFRDLVRDTDRGPWETWLVQRAGGALGAAEQDAARKAERHAGTPTLTCLDPLGRPFVTLADNGTDPAAGGRRVRFATRVELDVEGHQRVARDAVEQDGDERGRVVTTHAYDLAGNAIRQLGMEAGGRWVLHDAVGLPLRAWDSRGHAKRTAYDRCRRPLRTLVAGIDGDEPARELLLERTVYGEQHPEAEARNLRARRHLRLDQAGLEAVEAVDFKGNTLATTRRLTSGARYRRAVDWSDVDGDRAAFPEDGRLDPPALAAVLAPSLEVEAYTRRVAYDALDRPVVVTAPHAPSHPAGVIRIAYNVAELLERVEANLGGETEQGRPVWTPFVTNVDYDARGQRVRVEHGNGTTTRYAYDPLTFRLAAVTTERPRDAVAGADRVQALRYVHDPVGNVTSVEDDAQQAVFFRNRRAAPGQDFTYDAVYRLVAATGREHLGQAGGVPRPQAGGLPPAAAPGDAGAMSRYAERFVYDAVGNLLELRHRSADPGGRSAARGYVYEERSLLEEAKRGNRLTATTVGGVTERHRHDAHGNVTRLPHLGGADPEPNLFWDHADRLQAAHLGGGGRIFHVHDADGQRVRRVWEKSEGLVEERISLDGWELYRRRRGSAALARETLHVMAQERRIALVETRVEDTAGADRAPARLIRYQFGDLIGSVALELDDVSRVVSYEEYTPFGSTAYQATAGATEAPKRYRFAGREHDEATGLYDCGARWYAPWLGRWTAADPVSTRAGVNLYAYARNNPVARVDPTGTEDRAPPAATAPAAAPTAAEQLGWGLSFGFTLLTGQTPGEFGRGIAAKVRSLTVDPVVTLYNMTAKAGEKLGDKAAGVEKPDEAYVTKEESKKQLEAIVAVGAALLPGGKLTAGLPGPPVVTGGGELALAGAVEVSVPAAAPKAAVALATLGSGSAKRPKPKDEGPGRWQKDGTAGRNMSQNAAKYQKQVTGRAADETYYVRGGRPGSREVSFDGWEPGVGGEPGTLVEAKYYEDDGRFGRAYQAMLRGEYGDYQWIEEQAQRLAEQAREQVQAAEGTGARIEWRVSGREPTEAVRSVLRNTPGVGDRISVRHIPFEP
ncbi:MAG TPA: toxin TcdB middle/N-terminal domain-containing protein, partial [Solirubrobacteraceae bacterium]|nr:toxin TcdB middle/N-terminal domain-containing protein [Solirubrobacteraceae bacterium]